VPVETDTNDDWLMYEWLNKSLLSLAPYWRTERSYRHDQIIIEPDEQMAQAIKNSAPSKVFLD
jgi:hypothetical protein